MPNRNLILSLLALLAVQLGVWQWSLSYEHFLTLSGFLAINFMSITMLLAMRPQWLEMSLGGLDKQYHVHKWTGILGAVFALTHWLVEMGDDALKAVFGKDRSLREADFSGLLDSLQGMFEDWGEPGLYLLLALVAITLIRWVPYRFWRYLHRIMPLIYLSLAAHSLLLAPLSWWQQPTGWLMALLIGAGSIASLQSLAGLIGNSHRWKGVVTSVRELSDTTLEVVCDMGRHWPGHRAGQFALVTFDRAEGAHPFTLTTAGRKNGQLGFHIKALGDYTRTLPRRLHTGHAVTVEGPYGCFNPEKNRPGAQQVWVAGGVGITPFLAALENRLANRDQHYQPVTLHYCTHSAVNDPNVEHLHARVGQLPDVSLQIHDSGQGQRLTADGLRIQATKVDLWFCGPQGLAAALRSGLNDSAVSLRFHQERFEFR
ncbi:ferredoxin reductase family protein [Marinobacterium weihaiense]|uniref:Ferric reductase-like transmembrane domain-containing protein n=1 Tax=Marinobacterium weihaiense TaxID=2851016 RepID=A0ABS6MEB6_9GAMM|nr:ferric reductase-like transmembrane domain-containing protein [Marinobacterium weihaiense]MBV0934663.1 ferric reductase-like transmembrane domain-containing protein [Marinobacterium weihaiense]